MLTPAQETKLAAHIRANQDAAVVAALAIRNDTELARRYNLSSATDAWQSAMSARELFEATDVTKYDNITKAGKREAWRMMLDFAPIDFTRQKYRKVCTDVWEVAADATAVLQACTRKATVAEAAFGGAAASTGGVSALKLVWEGTLSTDDVSYSLNRNP